MKTYYKYDIGSREFVIFEHLENKTQLLPIYCSRKEQWGWGIDVQKKYTSSYSVFQDLLSPITEEEAMMEIL